jgi:uridylate kinase
MSRVAEPFDRREAIRRLEEGRVVLFAGGTGNPFFTTDTAAALRAAEVGAELLVKATKVDGVYDDDPMTNPSARRFEELSYMDLIRGRLEVMDASAVTLCMDQGLPVIVLDLGREGSLVRAICGEKEGTRIGGRNHGP